MCMIKSCIYRIRNTINNKSYIGSTTGCHRRKRIHFKLLSQRKHHCRHLQYAYDLYGKNNFVFEIIEFIPNNIDLVQRENWWITTTPNTYNVVQNGVLNHLGIKRSEETKKRISVALTGRCLSNETKEKIRLANIGKKQTADIIAKRVEPHYKTILQQDLNGNILNEWKSTTHAAQILGFNRNSIYRCLHGERHTYKKCKWIWK
jgi:group I intron endonuclease